MTLETGLLVQLSAGKGLKSEEELALVLLLPMVVLTVKGRLWKNENAK